MTAHGVLALVPDASSIVAHRAVATSVYDVNSDGAETEPGRWPPRSLRARRRPVCRAACYRLGVLFAALLLLLALLLLAVLVEDGGDRAEDARLLVLLVPLLVLLLSLLLVPLLLLALHLR